MRLFLIGFLSVITFSTYAQVVGGEQELPELVLKTLDGKEKNLNDYSKNEKFTIVSFWATWCTPCKKELQNISDLLPEWQEEFDVELLAISIDNARNAMKVKPFVQGKGWEFDVLLDINQDTQRELNFQTVPYSMLVDDSGNIVYKHTGYYEGDEYEMIDKIEEYSKK